jgi:antirestriction protein ArdC
MTMTATAAPARLTIHPEWDELLQAALEMPGQAGNTYNRFHRFSIGNQVLLMMQDVYEPVNTYKGWQALGRQVRKGSKAKSIYVPMFRKQEDKNGEEQQRLSGFKLVPSMFGVSETEGDDLPPFEPPKWSQAAALRVLKISKKKYRLVDGNVQGYSSGRDVAINPVAVYPFKTLMHELAHIVAGHTSEEQMADYTKHRGLKEFEAEASAYLIMNELGVVDKFDPAESRHYIQTWLASQDEKPDEKSIRRVFSTADKILRAGYPEEKKEEKEEA